MGVLYISLFLTYIELGVLSLTQSIEMALLSLSHAVY